MGLKELKRWIAGAVIALSAAAILWIRPWHGIGMTGNGYRWTEGEGGSYHFLWKTESRHGRGTESLVPLTVDMTGTLDMRILEAGTTVRLAFLMRRCEVKVNGARTPLMEDLFKVPVEILMEPSGRIMDFSTSRRIAAEDRKTLESTYRSMELIAEFGKTVYTRTQEDGLGSYTAGYRRTSAGFSRKKLGYVPEHSDNNKNSLKTTEEKRVTVLDSRTDFTVASGGNWIGGFTTDESVNVKTGSGDMTYVTLIRNSMRLERCGALDKQSPLAQGNGLSDWDRLVPSVFDGVTTLAGIKRMAVLKDRLKGWNRGLKPLAGSLKRGDMESSELFAFFLKSNPRSVKDIPPMLRQGLFNDYQRAEIINILGMDGSKEAQAALVVIAGDKGISERDRFRAIVSFSSLTRPPEPGTVDFLLGHTEKLGPGRENSELDSTPVLVAGAIAGNIREDDPEESDSLNTRLTEQLTLAGDPVRQSIILHALGNSRSPDNAGIISSYTDHFEPSVREAAAEELRRFDTAEINTILSSRLNVETHDTVKTRLLESLEDHDLDDSALKIVQLQLETSADSEVRNASIKILAGYAGKKPSVKACLSHALKTEPSRSNQTLLIKVIGNSGT